jgi:hypothetical protein
MADTPSTACARTWASTFDHLTALNHRLDQAPAHERDAIESEIAALQDELLDTPAPSLKAVMLKLEILFEGEMHGLDQSSEERRLILEDLHDLIQAQRQLLGA